MTRTGIPRNVPSRIIHYEIAKEGKCTFINVRICRDGDNDHEKIKDLPVHGEKSVFREFCGDVTRLISLDH